MSTSSIDANGAAGVPNGEPGPFPDAHLYALDSLGLTIARGLINAAVVAEASRHVRRVLDGSSAGKFPLLGTAEVFMDLLSDSWVVATCRRVLGDGFRFDHAFGLCQPGIGVNPNLHGGPASCQGASYALPVSDTFAAGVMRPALWGRVSVGIAMTGQTRQLGGFSCIPGSHKSSWSFHGRDVLARVFDGNLEHECIVTPDLAPGDAVLFNDALVHGARAWHGAQPRVALYYMYSPGFMAWRPYTQIERYAALARTPVERALFRPPYVASSNDDPLVVGDNQWREPLP